MTQGAVKPRRTTSGAGKVTRADAAGAVRIKVDGHAPDGADLPSHVYIAGTRKDCPIQNVHVRGIAFARFSGGQPIFADRAGEKLTPNDARRLGAMRWGCLVTMTDRQVEDICNDVANKVIVRRKTKDRVVGNIVSKSSPSFKTAANQEPLGRYLYLVRQDQVTGEQMESGDYPPMVVEE